MRLLQHDLVHLAQSGEGEGLAEEGVRDAAVLELAAQAPQRVVDDRVVVEGELGELVGGEPAHVLALAGLRGLVAADERPVDDRHDAARGRTVDVAEGVELLEVGRCELCGLEELAGGGVGEALGFRRAATGKRPATLERLAGAAHQRDRQTRGFRLFAGCDIRSVFAGAKREDDRRDGEIDAHDGIRTSKGVTD